MNKIFTAIIAIVAILFSTATFGQEAKTNGAKTAVIKVSNLHCNNDMPTIKKQLLNQDGVEEVTFTAISNESSTFTVIYQSAATSQDQIEKTIESTPGCDDQSEKPYRVKKQASGKKKKS